MMHYEYILIMLVMSLPVYVFWRWLYLKFITDKRKRLLAIWASTIFITPVIYLGAVYLLLFWICYYPEKNFDRNDWAGKPGKRYEMSANIINSKMLIGKTKIQVAALLGNPENNKAMDRWYYNIGIAPGLGVDVSDIFIIFKDEKVTLVGPAHW